MVSNSSPLPMLQELRDVRIKLLRLHKALLDSERVTYEQVHGRVSSSGEFFRLVIDHDWFSWLRPISQLIIQMDDVLSPKEPATLPQVTEVLGRAKDMLQPNENGSTLESRYYEAIQRDPEIAIMHGEISKLLADLS